MALSVDYPSEVLLKARQMCLNNHAVDSVMYCS